MKRLLRLIRLEWIKYRIWSRGVRQANRDRRMLKKCMKIADDQTLIYNKKHYVFKDSSGAFHVWTRKQLVTYQNTIFGLKQDIRHRENEALYVTDPKKIRDRFHPTK